jgi:hypothetical protein
VLGHMLDMCLTCVKRVSNMCHVLNTWDTDMQALGDMPCFLDGVYFEKESYKGSLWSDPRRSLEVITYHHSSMLDVW